MTNFNPQQDFTRTEEQNFDAHDENTRSYNHSGTEKDTDQRTEQQSRNNEPSHTTQHEQRAGVSSTSFSQKRRNHSAKSFSNFWKSAAGALMVLLAFFMGFATHALTNHHDAHHPVPPYSHSRHMDGTERRDNGYRAHRNDNNANDPVTNDDKKEENSGNH